MYVGDPLPPTFFKAAASLLQAVVADEALAVNWCWSASEPLADSFHDVLLPIEEFERHYYRRKAENSRFFSLCFFLPVAKIARQNRERWLRSLTGL